MTAPVKVQVGSVQVELEVMIDTVNIMPELISAVTDPCLELQMAVLQKDINARHYISNIHPHAAQYIAFRILSGR